LCGERRGGGKETPQTRKENQNKEREKIAGCRGGICVWNCQQKFEVVGGEREGGRLMAKEGGRLVDGRETHGEGQRKEGGRMRRRREGCLCVSANDLIVENRVLLVSHNWFFFKLYIIVSW